MYTWAVGSDSTAMYNISLVIPKIRWLGASKDLGVKHPPPADIEDWVTGLLRRPWVSPTGSSKVQGIIGEMTQGTGGIEDMGG